MVTQVPPLKQQRHVADPYASDDSDKENDAPVSADENGKNPARGPFSHPTMSFKQMQKMQNNINKPQVIIDLNQCHYQVVRDCAYSLGMIENTKPAGSDDFTMYWTDLSVPSDKVMKLRQYQVINHFPGMSGICRKVPMARNLNRMKRTFPQDYKFYPLSWVLPYDAEQFKKIKFSEEKTFIIKPNAGCQGRGIVLTKDKSVVDKYGDCVVQVYLDKPFLIEDYKFDLRVYCLVVSVDPLKVLLFRDGIVRMCTEPYQKPSARNIKQVCMHLTNYALNKHNDNFESSETDFSTGSKRDFNFLNDYVARQGHDPTQLWHDISDVMLKTILSIQPQLRHQYRISRLGSNAGAEDPPHYNPFNCFEILGFDIFLDHKLRPWLIEVNHSPSFNTDTALDKLLKYSLITESMALAVVDAAERTKHIKRERARAKERMHGNSSSASSLKQQQVEEAASDGEEEEGEEIEEDLTVAQNGNTKQPTTARKGDRTSRQQQSDEPLTTKQLIERQQQIERKNMKKYIEIYPRMHFDLDRTDNPRDADGNVMLRLTQTGYDVTERYQPFLEQAQKVAGFGVESHVNRLYVVKQDAGEAAKDAAANAAQYANEKGWKPAGLQRSKSVLDEKPLYKNPRYANVKSKVSELVNRNDELDNELGEGDTIEDLSSPQQEDDRYHHAAMYIPSKKGPISLATSNNRSRVQRVCVPIAQIMPDFGLLPAPNPPPKRSAGVQQQQFQYSPNAGTQVMNFQVAGSGFQSFIKANPGPARSQSLGRSRPGGMRPSSASSQGSGSYFQSQSPSIAALVDEGETMARRYMQADSQYGAYGRYVRPLR